MITRRRELIHSVLPQHRRGLCLQHVSVFVISIRSRIGYCMRSHLQINATGRPRPVGLFHLSVGMALIMFSAEGLHAQATDPESTNAKNPAAVAMANPLAPRVVTNIIHNPDGKGRAEDWGWWSKWSYSLSVLYDFSSQRSRVGDIPLESNSEGVDFTLTAISRPYTIFDFIYAYSHGSGTSGGGTSEVINQHFGEVRILQPLDFFWTRWEPAYQSSDRFNKQLGIIMDFAYGGARDSITAPNLLSQHDTQQLFMQESLLDGQIAIFPCRQDREHPGYFYPNWIGELSSGVQFSKFWFDSSGAGSATTPSRQLNYLNIASLTHSFACGLGFLVAVEWDAPLDSHAGHNGKPYYANTAIFTGGLVYNLYPETDSGKRNCLRDFWDLRRWSLSLLYSYTAFDPLTQTNTLQLQAFYSF